MRYTKSNPLLSLANQYIIDSPSPMNINYFYNIGSQLGLNQVILILTGQFQVKHYCPDTDLALISCEHIVRDVNNGWLIRYTHANGVAMFFIMVYIHIGKALYYGSYKAPRRQLWLVGVVIFITMMATGFLGYTQPFGQMSLWGATVITNLFSAIPFIGNDLVLFIYGGPSVGNPTINRFFSLHFLQPFILCAQVVCHLIGLHLYASNNPTGISSNTDKIRFHPYFTVKDLVGFFIFALILWFIVFFYPHTLGDAENNIPANPLVTPAHIVPEFYFLPFYAILRSIPDKLAGVIKMFAAILILIPISFIHTQNQRSLRYQPFLAFAFWVFIANFLFLLWLGACPVQEPFITLGQISTVIYFSYFFILMIFG